MLTLATAAGGVVLHNDAASMPFWRRPETWSCINANSQFSLLVNREPELADDWYDDNGDTMVDGDGGYLEAYPGRSAWSIGVRSRLTISQDR